jgi:hypothetical protein
MPIDRRITNGLAWAGAFLVVGVPTADLLSAQFLGDKAAPPAAQIAVVTPQNVAPVPAPQSQRPPAPKPVEVAAVKPAAPAPAPASSPAKPVAPSADAVENFVQSGKPLPSYITDAPAPKPMETAAVKPAAPAPAPAPVAPQPAPVAQPQIAAAAPVPVRTPIITQPALATPATDPIQTAAIPPKVAPTPMPLSMRPRPAIVAAANQQTGFAVNEPVFVPPTVQPMPPADITAEELEDWETGPLADFLARRQGQQQAEVEPRYNQDEEFFFERGQEFQRRDRLVGPEMFFYGN